MRKQIRLLFCLACMALVPMVALSGCGEQKPVSGLQYKNDVITIEDYHIWDTSPYIGSATKMDFEIKNNGEYPVPYAKVKFDAPGFAISNPYCEDGQFIPTPDSTGVGSCVFSNIEPSYTRKVSLELKTPAIDILQSQLYTVTYSIEYNYFGMKQMNIQIVDGTTRTSPLSRYSESTATYGPIAVSFEPPVGSTHVEGDQTIKDYWGIKDTPIKVKMKFTNIGSSSMGVIKDTQIDAGDIILTLGSFKRASVEDGGVVTKLWCDFCEPGEKVDNKACPGTTAGHMYSKEGLKVPGELTCNFQSLQFSSPEITGTIFAQFEYTYKYTRTQVFDVQPRHAR